MVKHRQETMNLSDGAIFLAQTIPTLTSFGLAFIAPDAPIVRKMVPRSVSSGLYEVVRDERGAMLHGREAFARGSQMLAERPEGIDIPSNLDSKWYYDISTRKMVHVKQPVGGTALWDSRVLLFIVVLVAMGWPALNASHKLTKVASLLF
jgi:hypothetical protein